MIEQEARLEETNKNPYATYRYSRLYNIPVTLAVAPEQIGEEGPELVELTMRGEIAIIIDAEMRVPTELQRLALFGKAEQVDDVEYTFFLDVDIVAPLNQAPFEERETGFWEAAFEARLFYSKIGIEYDTGGEEALHPPNEKIRGTLTLSILDIDDTGAITVDIQPLFFTIEERVDEGSAVNWVSIILDPISLRGVAPPPEAESVAANSFKTRCDQTEPCFAMGNDPNCSDSPPTVQKEIALKFINLSRRSDDDVMTWCQIQLDEVCKIWCRRGALDVDVQPELETAVNPTHKRPLFRNSDVKMMYGLDDANNVTDPAWRSYHLSHHVPVFIVDRLNQTGAGQGTTNLHGQAGAYVVLDVRAIDPNAPLNMRNPRILAHELCHVIGLNHPDSAVGDNSLPGQADTIAQSGAVPSSHRNTAQNLALFNSPQRSSRVLNKVLVMADGTELAIAACFNPNTPADLGAADDCASVDDD